MNHCRIPLLLLLALALAVPAFAGEPVRILTESYPPFNDERDGKVVGISTTIVRELFDRAGLAYSLDVVPWKRALDALDADPDTFVYTMARTPEREDKYIWLAKLFDRRISLIRLRDRSDLADYSLEDVRTKGTICVHEEDAALELIRSLEFAEKNIFTLVSEDQMRCIDMLLKKRVDFIPHNPYAITALVQDGTYPDLFTEHAVLVQEDGYYLTTNKDSDPAIIARLRKAYQELKQSGFIEKVSEDYLNSL